MVRRAGLSASLITALVATCSVFAACSYDSPIDLFGDASVVDASGDVVIAESGSDTPMPDGAKPDSSMPDGGGDADASTTDADSSVSDAPSDTAIPDASADAADADASVADASPDADAGPFVCTIVPFTNGVSTLAGCQIADFVDGVRDVARLSDPVNVAIGPGGDLYLADFDNGRVRVITPTGTVRTLVNQRFFQRPFGLAFAADGTLYVETDDNDLGQRSSTTGTVWRVDRVTGVATVIARNLGRPRGMLVLPSPDGRLVISDPVHHVVSFLDPGTGIVTPLAGTLDQPGWVDANGTSARFSQPYGVALLPDGRIALADYANNRIRAVALDGTVTTFAGTGVAGVDNGAVAAATFSFPQDLAIDNAGNLYVADSGNFVVRKIAGGQVSTVVGSGTSGWLDNDNLLTAKLYGLEGLDVSSDGATLWIADGNRGATVPFNRVRVVKLH